MSYSVNEAAEKLGRHPQTVREWLRKGRIQGTIMGDTPMSGYRISEREINYVLANGPRPDASTLPPSADMDAVAAAEFERIVERLNALSGHYAVVRWYPNGANPIWITGPYPTRARAETDLAFFRESSMYGPIAEAAVSGKE